MTCAQTLDIEDFIADQKSRAPYGGEPPYVKGSETSKEAAASIKPHLGRLAQQVFDFIEARGKWGATSNEIENALGLRHQTASARVRELYLAGRIEKTDMKRKTDSGRPAFVYVGRAEHG